MATREFPALPVEEYKSRAAQAIQWWTWEWQGTTHVFNPSFKYLADAISRVGDVKLTPEVFSRFWNGRQADSPVPKAEYAAGFARFYGKSIVEVLETFGHPTFATLIAHLVQERERLGTLDVYHREQLRLLQQTTTRAWELATDEWKKSVEMELCTSKTIEEKIRDVCAALAMRETARRKHPLANS